MKPCVALVGTAAGCEEAPYGDPAWEVWGLNDGYKKFPQPVQADRWFELHGDTPITRQRRDPDHWERLAALDIPVYTFHTLPSVPKATLFPLEQAFSHRRDYFASTLAWQIALALAEGFTTIGLYGTPLIYGREAIVERPCVEWWLGYAQGKGISVIVHHWEQHGLSRQPYRYAGDYDRREREFTYAAVAAHAETVRGWLPTEDDRLAELGARPFDDLACDGYFLSDVANDER